MRGLRCEQLVLDHYRDRGYVLVKKRWKSHFAEVDLVFCSANGSLVVVEVKSIHTADFVPSRLGWKQKLRLQRVIESLSATGKLVSFHLALVDKQDRVCIVESVFG